MSIQSIRVSVYAVIEGMQKIVSELKYKLLNGFIYLFVHYSIFISLILTKIVTSFMKKLKSI